MMFQRLIIALFLFFSSTAIWAASVINPQQIIEDTSEKMVYEYGLINQDKVIHRDDLYRLINDIMFAHFDVRRMSVLSVGKYWRKIPKNQRLEYVRSFRNLLINNYISEFASNINSPVFYLPLNIKPSDKTVVVRTQVKHADGDITLVNYRLYRGKDQWKVYDVIINGVSIVINFRTTFTAIIRKKGISSLIQQINNKAQQLENAAEK